MGSVLFAVLCLAAAFALGLRVIGVLGESKSAAQERLYELLAEPEEEAEVGIALDTRTARMARFTPAGVVAKTERNLVLAGHPDGWNLGRVLAMKLILGGVGLTVGLTMLISGGGIKALLVLLVATAVGYFAPDILLAGRATRRQELIEDALPEMLDQISISLDSGMSFEGAMSRIGEVATGPLGEEVVRTVQDIALGVPRRDAYASLARRTGIKDMKIFVRAINQGEEYGVAMADVVRDQSAEMRLNRRMRAETKANQVPVKMMFPLVVCILPTLFMIVLGPAILNAMAAFHGN